MGVSNQLDFELTGALSPELQITLPRHIRLLHVRRIVDAAYKRLLLGKRSLGLTNHIAETRQDDSVTSSDVFHAIGQASRQIELLFRPRLSASDTFQQVALADLPPCFPPNLLMCLRKCWVCAM